VDPVRPIAHDTLFLGLVASQGGEWARSGGVKPAE
jgi:hypothetical protein